MRDRATMMAEEAAVRRGPLIGRLAYEASLAALPTYPDGSRRKAWHELDEVERWSWRQPREEAGA